MKSRTTLVISVLTLGIVFGITFVILLSGFLAKNIINQQTKFYETLACAFAGNAANAIAVKDTYSLKLFVRDISRSENVVYAMVTDESGKIMAQTEPAAGIQGANIQVIRCPIDIVGARWGEIKIGYDASALDAKAASVRRYVLGFGFFVMLALSAYVLFFPNTITVPIMKLTARGLIGEEQRRFTRALTSVHVDFTVNQNVSAHGTIADISIAGTKLVYPGNLIIQKDDLVELVFAVSPDGQSREQKYAIKGRVTWLASGKTKSCGIQFETVNLMDRMKLADFINATKTKHEAWIREKLDELGNNTSRR